MSLNKNSKLYQKLVENKSQDLIINNNDDKINLKTNKKQNNENDILYGKSSKIKIKHAYWNQEEDIKIFKGLITHHFSWILIKNDIPGRTRISVRNRFINSIKQLQNGNKYQIISQFLFKNVFFTIGQ